MKPITMVSPAAVAGATDEQLVDAARSGSDEAFEVLFRRYRERIVAQVRGMVHDHDRSEDIVQEAFISALRNLRATEQEIAFKPWIHQIARNACIDHLRRVKRTEEISIDSEDFRPDFEGRLSERTPTTDLAVNQRQSLEDLQQAFGGLPHSQHEILVLRELEGLSYQEIGRRMRLTPAAVESMLSRARRSLKGQYDEIATGERCRRMGPVIAAAAGGLAGKRDRRVLERHVRHCRSCRQEAVLMGLEELVSRSPSRMREALSKAAALLPLPALFRRRPDAAAETASGAGGSPLSSAHASLSHLGTTFGSVGADHTASAIQKAAAVIAVAAVAGGGGYAAHKAGAPLPLPKGKESKASPSQRDAANNLLTPASDRVATGQAGSLGAGGTGSSAAGAVTTPGSPATSLAPGSAAPYPGSGGPVDGTNGNAGTVPGAQSPGSARGLPGVVPLGSDSLAVTPGAEAPLDQPKLKKKESKTKANDIPSTSAPVVIPTTGDGSSGGGSQTITVPAETYDSLPKGIKKKLEEAADGGKPYTLPPGQAKRLLQQEGLTGG